MGAASLLGVAAAVRIGWRWIGVVIRKDSCADLALLLEVYLHTGAAIGDHDHAFRVPYLIGFLPGEHDPLGYSTYLARTSVFPSHKL
jgi:hypothetical protein